MLSGLFFFDIMSGSMFFAVEAQSHELDALLDEFRATLRQINNFNFGDRQQKLQICAQLEQQIKTVRAGYILEVKTLEDKESQNKCRQWLRERNATFQNLVCEYEIRKNEIDRNLLEAGNVLVCFLKTRLAK